MPTSCLSESSVQARLTIRNTSLHRFKPEHGRNPLFFDLFLLKCAAWVCTLHTNHPFITTYHYWMITWWIELDIKLVPGSYTLFFIIRSSYSSSCSSSMLVVDRPLVAGLPHRLHIQYPRNLHHVVVLRVLSIELII